MPSGRPGRRGEATVPGTAAGKGGRPPWQLMPPRTAAPALTLNGMSKTKEQQAHRPCSPGNSAAGEHGARCAEHKLVSFA